MISVKTFIFGPFQENTYVLYDDTQQCIIIDPGCYETKEKNQLADFISTTGLTPVKLINTHGHIDHMLGNNFVASKYNLQLEMNEYDEMLLKAAPTYGQMWGIQAEPSPAPSVFLKEGDEVKFGHNRLQVLFTPGHSEGSISFYHRGDNFVIAGDVLFFGSIGRTDLPGGNLPVLINSITKKLFPLGDACKVYSGHGPVTHVGYEKENNPFLQ